MMDALPPLIVLTDMTGVQADAERTVTIGRTEIARPVALALLVAALPTIVVGGFLGALGGIALGLSSALIVAALVVWGLIGRSRGGLQQRYLRTLRDRTSYNPGEATLCGKPLDPFGTEVGFVVRSSVPVAPRVLDPDDPMASAARDHLPQVDVAAFGAPTTVRPGRRLQAHRRGHVAPLTLDPVLTHHLFATRVQAPGRRMRALHAAALTHQPGAAQPFDIDSLLTPKPTEPAS